MKFPSARRPPGKARWLQVKQDEQQENTKSTKEETQKAQRRN
jgi:hypothetical protein